MIHTMCLRWDLNLGQNDGGMKHLQIGKFYHLHLLPISYGEFGDIYCLGLTLCYQEVRILQNELKVLELLNFRRIVIDHQMV